MTIRELLQSAEEKLRQAGIPDPKIDAEYLLSTVRHISRLELLLKSSDTASKEEERLFMALLLSRMERIPLQYLLGMEDFYGLRLKTDSRALIPRPETELLCEAGLKALKGKPNVTVLDLCTGSGAIALAVKKNRPDALVYASDISEAALALAKENAADLHLDVRFIRSDLFSGLGDLRFDMILSNPPYIPTTECMQLQQEVRREPILALDGGEDGLRFYRSIAKEAPLYLKNGGHLMVECGLNQGDEVAQLFADNGLWDIQISRDYEGHPRIVAGLLPGE